MGVDWAWAVVAAASPLHPEWPLCHSPWRRILAPPAARTRRTDPIHPCGPWTRCSRPVGHPAADPCSDRHLDRWRPGWGSFRVGPERPERAGRPRRKGRVRARLRSVRMVSWQLPPPSAESSGGSRSNGIDTPWAGVPAASRDRGSEPERKVVTVGTDATNHTVGARGQVQAGTSMQALPWDRFAKCKICCDQPVSPRSNIATVEPAAAPRPEDSQYL